MQFDIAVIGGGIAGAGLAAELSPTLRVAVLEQESQPGYHATGRSAAAFAEHHRSGVVHKLSRASRAFLDASALLRPRGYLFLAREEQVGRLREMHAVPAVRATARWLTPRQARERMPLLREDGLAAALIDDTASDIDVHGLHQACLATMRRHGGRLLCNARVASIERESAGWRLTTAAGVVVSARIVVNAAGAWADEVAAMAGVRRLGLQPLRRSAALVDVPAGAHMDRWPMALDVAGEFYFKPDAGRLLISPGDETLSDPCDAMPEELDLAMAVDRIERVTTLDVRRMHSRWAGLRTFVADRMPVAGFDPAAAGFYWLAGQGGTGIQVAPALSRFAAAQVLGRPLPRDFVDLGIDAAELSPSRATLTLRISTDATAAAELVYCSASNPARTS